MAASLVAALLLAVAAGAGLLVAVLRRKAPPGTPQGRFVGPIIDGRNYSDPVPELTVTPDGFAFDFPTTGGIDAVIQRRATLPRSASFTVTADPGVGFIAADGSKPATVCAMFQREGDTWSGRDGFEFFRWYGRPVVLAAGAFALPLDGWTSVNGQRAEDHPAEFAAALSEIDNFATAFGAYAGRSHGARANGAARFEARFTDGPELGSGAA